MKNKNCNRPCGTCPWLTSNHGRNNPENLEKLKQEQPDFDWYDWYSVKNLKRLWRQLSQGEVMACHSSDPNASEYGGKDAKNSEIRLCLGAVALVYKHIEYIQNFLNKGWKGANVNVLYRRAAGDFPLTKRGQSEWVMMFAIGRTDFTGGLEIPREIDSKSYELVSVPWNDSIVNKNK